MNSASFRLGISICILLAFSLRDIKSWPVGNAASNGNGEIKSNREKDLSSIVKKSILLKENSNNHKMKESNEAKEFVENAFSEVSHCIVGCGKCAQAEHLYNNKGEASAIVVCANSCLISSELVDLVEYFSTNRVFTKSFTRCFLDFYTGGNDY